MGTIKLDSQIRLWRAVMFPFFDRVEIAFSIFIVVLEVVVIAFLEVKNGWAIPAGSYVGMAAVAWSALPSKANLEPRELVRVRQVVSELRMREVSPGRFVPPLPKFLRWPRNAIVLSAGAEPSLSGPRALLINIRERMCATRVQ